MKQRKDAVETLGNLVSYRQEAERFAAKGMAAPDILSEGPSEVRYRELLVPNFDASSIVASVARVLDASRATRRHVAAPSSVR